MKNTIKLLLLCFPVLINAQSEQYTYDVILCLDDRIAESDQRERDIQLIMKVFEDYKRTVFQGKYYIHSEDAFRVLIVPQRGMSTNVSSIASGLSIDLRSIPAHKRRTVFDQFEDKLQAKLEELYESAYQGREKSAYNGTNIWRYFNGEYIGLTEQEGRARKVFILTDGYIDFERSEPVIKIGGLQNHTGFIHAYCKSPDWKERISRSGNGLLPCDVSLDGAEIYVMELNPKCGNYFEGALLKWIWKDWLGKMDACKIRLFQHTNISSINF